jgi:hypothetical protein
MLVLLPSVCVVGAKVGVSLGIKGVGVLGLSFGKLEGAKVEMVAAGAKDGFKGIAEATVGL